MLRQRLRRAGHAAAQETVAAQLGRIQRQSLRINQGAPISKNAHILWAVMTRGERFEPHRVSVKPSTAVA